MPKLTALALLAALAAPVAAQQPDTTARRDTASRARADSARAQQLGPVVVSGTRLTTAADERTPVQVDVIQPDKIPPGPVGAASALARLPGVSISNDQGTRVQPTLDIRGFTLSPVVGVPQGVSVFLDGVRINEPDAQELNFDLIPMDAVTHAELIRGPDAIFGKNTLAGALNLFTGRGGATPKLEASVEGGTYGYRDAHVIASGMRGGIDGYLMVNGSTEDGYQAESQATTRQIFATVGRKRDSSDVALSVLYAHDDIYEAGSLPASWIDVARRANYTNGDFFRPDLIQASLRGMQQLGGAQLRGDVYVRRNAITQYNVNVGDPNNIADITNRSIGGTAELELPTRIGARALALTVGGEYARNDVTYRLFDQTNPAAPQLPPDCDQTSGLCEDARVNGDDAALYAQALFQATTRLSLLASGRGDYVRVPFRDLRDPSNDGTSTFWRFSPKVGATYVFSDALRGYVSVGSGFRAPAALELACASAEAPCPLPFSLGADPALRPVVAWNYEAGIDWDMWEGASLDLVGFRMNVNDEIVFTNTSTAAGFFQNIPRTRRDGVEASVKVRLPAGLSAFGSYTYMSATYRSTFPLESALDSNVVAPGDHFALSPEHRATAGIEAVRVLGTVLLDGQLSMRAVSSQYLRGDEANRTAPLPAYAVFDLRLGLEHEHYGVSAYVGNLFDRKYVVYGVYGENPKGPFGGPAPAVAPIERWYTPAYPRTLTVTLSIKR